MMRHLGMRPSPSFQYIQASIFFLVVMITACSSPNLDSRRSPLQLPETKSPELGGVRLALIEPLQTHPSCNGEVVLISLPDEIACKEKGKWVLTSGGRILQPLSALIVSLRYAGLSTFDALSLADAKQDGARIGILPLLTRSDARISGPSLDESSSGKHMKVIATVAIRFVVVDLITDAVLWQGDLEQSVEDVLPVPPLTESSKVIAAGAGIGQFEPSMYAIRSLILQAYVQLGQSLAQQLQNSALKERPYDTR